ncbi:Beta-diketonase [Saitozyma sp. JCM 24511]|nr:Beta-diketonase [Saitozyma sp. JCM 24511]
MSSSSWLNIHPESPFSLSNLPFGIISQQSSVARRAAVAVGDYAIDLLQLSQGGVFDDEPQLKEHSGVFSEPTLNAFAALGRCLHQQYRLFIRDLLLEGTSKPTLLKDNPELQRRAILPLQDVITHVPMAIGDYTDFYAGINHAYNVGVLFRGPDNALQPNYLHLPVGYHGRASSIQASGSPVYRPRGQTLPAPGAKTPVFGSSKKLDIELELAAFVCKDNEQGMPIRVNEAHNHIFGYVLMNDWSARDIQAWEYVPLGPFNSKNFATTISPWVVLADALEPFRTRLPGAPANDRLLPYLQQSRPDMGFDIQLTVDLVVERQVFRISECNSRHLCFSFEQMLAHHTVTGCPMRTGDLIGSGTISGRDETSLGSLLEMTKNGMEPISPGMGITRMFLEDGDEIVLSGIAGRTGERVGFGDCRGRIAPART